LRNLLIQIPTGTERRQVLLRKPKALDDFLEHGELLLYLILDRDLVMRLALLEDEQLLRGLLPIGKRDAASENALELLILVAVLESQDWRRAFERIDRHCRQTRRRWTQVDVFGIDSPRSLDVDCPVGRIADDIVMLGVRKSLPGRNGDIRN